jgi:hypothetical protein
MAGTGALDEPASVDTGAGVTAPLSECSVENTYSFTFQTKPLGITVTGNDPIYVKRMKRDCSKDPVCIGAGDRVIAVQGKNFSHGTWSGVMDFVKTLTLPFTFTFCRAKKCDERCDEQSPERVAALQLQCK